MSKNGSKTVLVVDDAPFILDVIRKMLSSLDCRLFLAASGEEALKLTKSSDVKIDLLLTDVFMPGMNGLELAQTLKSNQPQIKIVFMSGSPNYMVAERLGVLTLGDNFIQKPLMPTKLVHKLSAMLDEK